MSGSHVRISCRDQMCIFQLDFPFLLLSISQYLAICIYHCPFQFDFPFLLRSISQIGILHLPMLFWVGFPNEFFDLICEYLPTDGPSSNNNHDCLCITLWLILGMVLLISNAKVVTFFPHDMIEFWDNRQFRSGVPGFWASVIHTNIAKGTMGPRVECFHFTNVNAKSGTKFS